jgi:FtsZ-binding cell division protein ZapB
MSNEEVEKLGEEKVALYAEVKKYREDNDALQKQKILLQQKCRQAGSAIIDQGTKIKTLTHEIDRLSEENDNLRRMLGSNKDDTE